ncbi:MAG: carotenoid biosynthesis protein [Flavobacteriaceae bacterium]|nr:carotenoid biosynthesis protein [Flavobacteriaceae bacterium]
MNPIKLNLEIISIGIIWLFHVSGIIGILYGNSDWFISATPLNLSINFILLLLNCNGHKLFFPMVIIGFLTGMITEILGVQWGWIFGDYQYLDALGYKVLGVPVLIGVNWALLAVITGAIAQQFYENIIMRIIIGVALMLFLDLLIEPIAPMLDFWVFEGGEAPLQNYIGWAAVAFFLQFIFHFFKISVEGWFPHQLYLLQIIFFTVLLIKQTTIGL